MDDLIEWPEFCAAAKSLRLSSWERAALDEIGEFEDGPRTLAKWNALLRKVAREHNARLVAQLRAFRASDEAFRRLLN